MGKSVLRPSRVAPGHRETQPVGQLPASSSSQSHRHPQSGSTPLPTTVTRLPRTSSREATSGEWEPLPQSFSAEDPLFDLMCDRIGPHTLCRPKTGHSMDITGGSTKLSAIQEAARMSTGESTYQLISAMPLPASASIIPRLPLLLLASLILVDHDQQLLRWSVMTTLPRILLPCAPVGSAAAIRLSAIHDTAQDIDQSIRRYSPPLRGPEDGRTLTEHDWSIRALCEQIVDLLESCSPKLRHDWKELALEWTATTDSPKVALRSLQVVHALHMEVDYRTLSMLLERLSNNIAEATLHPEGIGCEIASCLVSIASEETIQQIGLSDSSAWVVAPAARLDIAGLHEICKSRAAETQTTSGVVATAAEAIEAEETSSQGSRGTITTSGGSLRTSIRSTFVCLWGRHLRPAGGSGRSSSASSVSDTMYQSGGSIPPSSPRPALDKHPRDSPPLASGSKTATFPFSTDIRLTVSPTTSTRSTASTICLPGGSVTSGSARTSPVPDAPVTRRVLPARADMEAYKARRSGLYSLQCLQTVAESVSGGSLLLAGPSTARRAPVPTRLFDDEDVKY